MIRINNFVMYITSDKNFEGKSNDLIRFYLTKLKQLKSIYL